MEDNERCLKDLKIKRRSIKAALTRAQTFLTNFNPRDDPISQLEFRQEGLPRISNSFDEIQSQIELINESVEENETEREEFENKYYGLRSQIQDIISAEKEHNLSMNNTHQNISFASVQRARLPPVDLPKFDGNIQEWESFYGFYKALVHEDDRYPAVQKFSYLRSSLSGQALDIVKGIPMTEANYEAALGKLKRRYDNRSLVIQSHIRAILDLPQVQTSSARELQALQSKLSAHVASLKELNQPVDQWDAWLVTISLRKLDHASSHEWQLRRTDTNLPTFTQIEEFLLGRCIAFESSEASSNSDCNILQNLQAKGNARFLKKSLLAANDTTTCTFCSGSHRIFYCEKFKALRVNSRSAAIREKGLCYNCLSSGHVSKDCKSIYTCRICKGRHNSLLHVDKKVNLEQGLIDNNANESGQSSNTQEIPKVSAAASLNAQATGGYVFLATAIVLAQDKYGRMKECKAILDTGSQINFISKRLAKLLQLPSQRSSLPVSGIGSSTLNASTYVEIKVHSRVRDYSIKLLCYVLPNIVGCLPSCTEPKEGWNIPQELRVDLADPKFYEAGSVDLLIGAGAFYELLESERIPLGVGNLSLQGTTFGWVVTGELGAACLIGVATLGESIEQDWVSRQTNKEEAYGKVSKSNKRCIEEEKALLHYKDTVTRDKQGRFVLKLPVKSHADPLGDSSSIAASRLIGIERRLQRDDELRAEYNNFMKEYLEMGHMSEVLGEMEIPKRACYLPHHAVLKSTSLTTKVRVVFDASARTTTGHSLNDILLRGPTVQEDIFSILTRFRKHQFVITADIEKMFRQINIAESDQDLQRIMWRFSPSEAIRTYRLSTVTYGTTPASFMATQCLVTLAEEFKNQYPEASRVIAKDFYMDDLMSGADSEEQCSILEQQISRILNSAKLPLRKWCSNSSTVLKKIGKGNADTMFTLEIKEDDTIKSLGLGWQPFTDQFKFNVTIPADRSNLTKRKLLSDLNRVFDPLGFLGPVLIKGKIFLQHLWQLKIDWDEQLESEIQERWKLYYAGLEYLKQLNIPRKSKPYASDRVEIHGFSDASMEAYGACVYIRSLDKNGKWNSRLLCSRSRVAPLKGATIPRLELSGALLLAQLVEKVADSWNIKCETFYLWTDSTIVLGWLNSHASRLKTFVANRVCQILEKTRVQQWNHVATDENPADVLSRGIETQKLQEAKIWWFGPYWLEEDSSTWRNSSSYIKEHSLPELKPVQLTLYATKVQNPLLSAYSEWNKLVRATAWIRKFFKYLKYHKSVQDTAKHLTVLELKEAEYKLIKQAQYEEFGKEIDALSKKQEISRGSKIKGLCPFIGKDNLLVVGGRLHNSNLDYYQKHPIILPFNNKLTRLIFENYHKILLHGGPQLLLAEIRLRFWPMKGRAMARSVTSRCVTCVRAKPKFEYPVMATLPKARVQPARPFMSTGVDFAGPLAIRSGLRRVSNIKAWIAVFVCLSTRAVHLEPVVGLTKGAFLASLRRFMARRGKCASIYSDNGTNFVGAQRELDFYLKNIDADIARDGIEWHFNPPAAPHFGGIWESAVKSAKFHLTRVVKEARLTLEELITLLCEIEACLNSRPLVPLSSSPSDLEALTPAHFLVGGPLLLIPEPDLNSEKVETLRRWSYVQALMQGFWKRWTTEYLPQLQVRGKWTAKSTNLKIGDLVIIKEDMVVPGRWKMGRVLQTHPGSDGTVRVVTLRTSNGNEMKRPVVKLCRLPIEAENDEK